MAELLDDHEVIDAYRQGIAHAVDVVACQVDKHDVLGAVFQRVSKLVGEPLIILRRLATLDGAGDGMCDDATFL